MLRLRLLKIGGDFQWLAKDVNVNRGLLAPFFYGGAND